MTMHDVDALEREINSGYGTDAVHRLVAERVAESEWLKELIADAWLEGARHAWRRAEGKASAWGLPVTLAQNLPRHVRNQNPHRNERRR
jgi:hypothetical protein